MIGCLRGKGHFCIIELCSALRSTDPVTTIANLTKTLFTVVSLCIVSIGGPDVHAAQSPVPGSASVREAKGSPAESYASQSAHLILRLKNKSASVRLEAVLSIGNLSNPHLAYALLPLLGDKNDSVADAAIIALGKCKNPVAIDPLIKVLTSEKAGKRKAASKALLQIGLPAIPKLANALANGPDSDSERSYTLILKQFGDPTVDSLINALSSASDVGKCRIADLLTSISDDRAIDPLIGLLDDRSDIVRKAASADIAKFGATAVPFLLAALGSSDLLTQDSAIEVLSSMPDLAVSPLMQAVDTDDPNLRDPAMRALVATLVTMKPASVEPLLSTFDDRVRIAAATALGQTRDIRAVQPLVNGLEAQDSDVEDAFSEALARIGTTELVPDGALFNQFEDRSPFSGQVTCDGTGSDPHTSTFNVDVSCWYKTPRAQDVGYFNVFYPGIIFTFTGTSYVPANNSKAQFVYHTQVTQDINGHMGNDGQFVVDSGQLNTKGTVTCNITGNSVKFAPDLSNSFVFQLTKYGYVHISGSGSVTLSNGSVYKY